MAYLPVQFGQNTMAYSWSVAIASDQTEIPVSAQDLKKTNDLLTALLAQAQVTNQLLSAGLNLRDDPAALSADFLNQVIQ